MGMRALIEELQRRQPALKVIVIGRDAEVRNLEEHLGTARGGEPWVEVRGGRGIGKTRLVQEAAKRTKGRRLLVVVAGSGTPYRQVNAYSQTNGGGTLIGSFTTGTYPDTANEIQTCDFTSALGVKEIQVRTDFAENDVRYFVIHSSATSGGSDSKIPACAFTISPSGQNVMPSP